MNFINFSEFFSTWSSRNYRWKWNCGWFRLWNTEIDLSVILRKRGARWCGATSVKTIKRHPAPSAGTLPTITNGTGGEHTSHSRTLHKNECFKRTISIFIIFKMHHQRQRKNYASGLRMILFSTAAVYCYKVDKRCINKVATECIMQRYFLCAVLVEKKCIIELGWWLCSKKTENSYKIASIFNALLCKFSVMASHEAKENDLLEAIFSVARILL